MRKRTITLLLAASAIYYAILGLVLGLLPTGLNTSLYFPVVPLLALVLILARDMSKRATVPTEVKAGKPPLRRLSREVQELTRQIEVGIDSSSDYFEKILMAKLREVFVEKVALEMGLDGEKVRTIFENPRLGPGFLRNEPLYRLLYSGVAAKGSARVKMLDETIGLVESWRP